MTKRSKLLLASVLAVAALVGGSLLWFFGGDTPDEVSLETATDQLVDTSGTSGTSDADDAATSSGEIAGTWQVDNETGDFDYETATGSFVGFRIEEELSSIGSTTAVGRTGDVDGTLVIDGTTVTSASFEVDVTTITTEDSRRDDNVQDALESGDFPTAGFELTEPIELGDGAGDGEAVSVTATGDLTIHGVTKSISMPLEAQLVDDTIVVVGSMDIVFSDYGVTVPESQIVVSVDDFGTLELQLLFTS